jgi:hypothetical protein
LLRLSLSKGLAHPLPGKAEPFRKVLRQSRALKSGFV